MQQMNEGGWRNRNTLCLFVVFLQRVVVVLQQNSE